MSPARCLVLAVDAALLTALCLGLYAVDPAARHVEGFLAVRWCVAMGERRR